MRNGKSGLVECHSSRPGETPKQVRGLPFNRAIKTIRYPNLMPVQTKRTIVSRRAYLSSSLLVLFLRLTEEVLGRLVKLFSVTEAWERGFILHSLQAGQ